MVSDFTKTIIVDADGNGDAKTIKEGVDALYSGSPPVWNGGVVIVEQGTYIIDGTNTQDDGDRRTVETPSNLTIIGRGNAVIEVANNVAAFRNQYFASGTNENITISGFKIVVTWDDVYGHPSTYPLPHPLPVPEDPPILPGPNIIEFKNVSKCILEKLYITADQSTSGGVFPGDPLVDDERFYPTAAIKIEGNPSSNCTDNIIRQCTVTEFGNSVGEGIENNYYGIGIVLKRCERTKIENNFVQHAKMGCLVEQGPHNVVACNVFRDMLEFTRATGAPYLNNGGLCVRRRYLNQQDYPAHYTVIKGNIIDNCISHGIYMSGVSGCTVQGNICTRNGNYSQYVEKEGDQRRHGIRIAYRLANYNTVIGNVFFENYASGIQLGGSANNFAACYNTIYGNSCCNNNYYGILLATTLCDDEDQPTCDPGHYPEDDKVKHNILVGNMCHGNNSGQIEYLSSLTEDIIEADNLTS